MANYTVTITLGTGDKGKNWDTLLRQQAKRNRQSIGAYVRAAIYEKVQRETTPKTAAAAQPTQPAPAPGAGV